MRLYQTSDRTYFWNEAHNHYLQAAAEGGLLLFPAAAALAAFVPLAIRAVRRRGDPAHWLRVGATAALVSVAIQSVWETGLTLPANGMLAAAAAALVVAPFHSVQPAQRVPSMSSGQSTHASRSSSNDAARN
jgi:O-antigen ligase